MNEQITSNQHFVPRFYLKNFADVSNKVHILDVKNGRLSNPKSPSKVGREKFFYAQKTGVFDEASQIVEEYFKLLEDQFAKRLPIIIDKILHVEQNLDEDDKYFLSLFMCTLWLRSPYRREQMNCMQEDFLKEIASRDPDRILRSIDKLPEEEQNKLIETMEKKDYRLQFDNSQHLQFMMTTMGIDGPGFTNMFFGMKWKIYINKTSKKFITSDSPVVEYWDPPKIFYGPSFLSRKKYFALTPNIFIKLSYPHGSDKIKRKTLFENDVKKVDFLNILIADHVFQYAYSLDEEILKKMIEGKKGMGEVEMYYYKNYFLPWREYNNKRMVKNI